MRVALGLIQALLMIGGPLGLAAYLRARFRLPWSMWAIGAAAFILSQVVHVPLLMLLGPFFPRNFAAQCVLLGLFAGLCEEPARYLVYRFWLKKARTYEESLLVGLGHGGIESIILGLLVLAGLLGSLSVQTDDPVLRAAATATLNAPPLGRFYGAIERVFAITFHVAMSVVVMSAVRRGRVSLLVLAIALHALMDGMVVWVSKHGGMVWAEVVALFAAALGLVIILNARGLAVRARARGTGDVDEATPPDEKQAISTRALTKEFANRTAVNRITVDVAPGKVFAVLGPNGAGKTTTVRMLCALIPPTSGTARVAGALLVRDDDELRKHVGILTETPGLYERLTAYENLELFSRLYGLDEATRRARIEKHLRAFDVWERRDDAVSGFSKGMKQKIAIVRALIHEPEVLFLDEPTSGLDPIASREVHDMILSLKKQGRTILLTTHRLTEAEELADLVGIVRGDLLALDTVSSLKSRMFGKQVEVRVSNAGNALSAALAADPLFARATWDAGLLSIPVDDPASETPGLVRALVRAGADIVSVGDAKHSLEEIYLELVSDKVEADAAGASESKSEKPEKKS